MYHQHSGDVQHVTISLWFYALIASLPLQCIGVDIGLIISVDVVCSVIFVIVYGMNCRSMCVDGYDLMLTLFIVWCMISGLYNVLMSSVEQTHDGVTTLRVSSWRPLYHVMRLVYFFLFYKVVKRYLSDHSHNIGSVMQWISIVFLFLALYGIYQEFALQHDLPLSNLRMIRKTTIVGGREIIAGLPRMPRIFSVFMEPSNYGHFLIMAIPLQYGIVHVFKKNIHFFILLLLITNLLLAFPRGSLFAIAAGVLCYVIITEPHKLLYYCFFLILIVLFMVLLLHVCCGIQVDVVQFVRALLSSYSWGYDASAVRIATRSSEAFAVGIQHPLFGVGLGNFSVMTDNGVINPVRGLIPRLFADVGVMGVLFFSLFACMHVINGLRHAPKGSTRVLRHAFATSLLCGLLQMSFFYNGGMVLIYFWFYLAFSAVLNMHAENIIV